MLFRSRLPRHKQGKVLQGHRAAVNTTVLVFRKDFLEVIPELCLESRIDFSWLMMVEVRWEKVTQAKEITF